MTDNLKSAIVVTSGLILAGIAMLADMLTAFSAHPLYIYVALCAVLVAAASWPYWRRAAGWRAGVAMGAAFVLLLPFAPTSDTKAFKALYFSIGAQTRREEVLAAFGNSFPPASATGAPQLDRHPDGDITIVLDPRDGEKNAETMSFHFAEDGRLAEKSYLED